MNKCEHEAESVIVSRCGGYPLVDLLKSENRKKAREITNSPNYVNSKYFLKEIFSDFGITVNPEAMTYVHIGDL